MNIIKNFLSGNLWALAFFLSAFFVFSISLSPIIAGLALYLVYHKTGSVELSEVMITFDLLLENPTIVYSSGILLFLVLLSTLVIWLSQALVPGFTFSKKIRKALPKVFYTFLFIVAGALGLTILMVLFPAFLGIFQVLNSP